MSGERERPDSADWLTSQTILGQLANGRAVGPAWGRFDEKYRPLILNVYRARGYQQADAEDLTQNALLRLYKNLPTFTYDPQTRFRHFVFRVLKTVQVDLIRNRTRHPDAVGRGAGDGDDADDPEGSDPQADAVAEGLERDRLVGLAAAEVLADGFEPNEAEAVRLHVFEGRPAAEVAAAAGLPQAKVYQLRYRFDRRFRKLYLQRHPDDVPDGNTP